jgi:hypothetical protein
MSKKQKGVRVVMMSGDDELASFKASNFKSAEEINIALNLLVKVIVGTIVSASAHVLSKVSDGGSAKDIINATNDLLDIVVKHSKETINESINHFAEEKSQANIKKGSDA